MKTDKTKLSQIIQNLLTNAIKAIDKNGNIDIILRESNKNITKMGTRIIFFIAVQ